VTAVADARILDLPRISLPQGDLTPVEGGDTIPFEIQRVFYLYDVVGGASRGGHAHRELEQLIVATMGAFTVVVDDGESRSKHLLARGHQGLYVPPMLWSEILDFSSGAVCVVLASMPYQEGEYIRDYDEFVAIRRAAQGATR
jgi:hypothetical protein